MDKKKRLSIFLILTLALLLALGTIAYYTKTFTSDNNKVRAARFEVDSNGTLDGNERFDLTGEPIYPGIEREIYEFEIDKKQTEVPVKYDITVTPYDELFEAVSDGDSPVSIKVLRKVGEDWIDIGGLDNVEIIPENNVEKFKIWINWNHSDYDIKYQGKSGKIMINVVATQIFGDTEPEEPADPTDPEPDMTVWYFKWGVSQYIVLEDIGIDGAETYQATVNGKKLGNIANIGKALPVSREAPHPIESFTLHVYGARPSDGRLRPLLWEGKILNPEFRGVFPPDPYL